MKIIGNLTLRNCPGNVIAWAIAACVGMLLFLSSRAGGATVTEAWVQRYGSEAGSAYGASKVVTDAGGNVIVAGSTGNQTGGGSDLLIIKYSGFYRTVQP